MFSAISDALAWIFGCARLVGQVHYLDDFLFLKPPGFSGLFVTEMVSSFCRPNTRQRVPRPLGGHCLVGIMLDDKLQLMSALIQAWSCCSVCQQRELESFLGHLSHAATVIQQGCPFLRGLFQLLSVARQPHHFVWLTRGAKANILWLFYLKKWNGKFFPQDVPSVHVYMDASG